jgi:hypothetical protein
MEKHPAYFGNHGGTLSLPVLLEIARNACNKKGIQLVALLI